MKLPRLFIAATAGFALAFLAGCASSGPGLRGDPNPVAYRPHNPSAVKVKVSLAKQQVYVMEGDRPLLVAATCVGTPAKPTPKGTYRVFRKIANKRSNSYGYWAKGNEVRPGESSKPPGSGYRYVGYPMQFWVEFLPAYGFHQGYVWPVPRTHGCLRFHKNVAAKFYELVQIGTPVQIADRWPEDETVGKAVPRPGDFNDPDPDPHYMISSAVFQAPSGPLLQ